MTSFRASMLRLKDSVFKIKMKGNGGLDVTLHQVTIRTRTWLGGAIEAPVDAGPQYTDSDLVIAKKYQVRQIATQVIDESGGRYEEGDIVVKGIVPANPENPGIGYTPQQLAPSIVPGQEAIYVLKGPHGGEYALRELRTFKLLSYDLVLSRRLTTPTLVPE